jgi:ribosomal protein S27E
MEKVTRYTRAGQNGKFIVCPKCKHEARVYHFSWSAIGCQKCKKMIDKKEWSISQVQKERNHLFIDNIYVGS